MVVEVLVVAVVTVVAFVLVALVAVVDVVAMVLVVTVVTVVVVLVATHLGSRPVIAARLSALESVQTSVICTPYVTGRSFRVVVLT